MFHASLHTVGLVALVLAIAAVVLSKVWNMPARGHMYTVHSYIGAATVALSLVQVRGPAAMLSLAWRLCTAQCCQVLPTKVWKRRTSLWLWAQFLWALGFVKALGLSERARFTLAAYHRPLGFGITIAGLTTVLVRAAKPG